MKPLSSCLIIGVFCLALASVGAAQQSGASGKTHPGTLADEVCRAIEQYIAGIDSARTARDKVDRDQKYAQAQQALVPVLERSGKASLLSEISAYAQQSELVVTTDPTDPKYEKLVAQRVGTRSKLLEWCSSFSLTR